ncbi:AlbA family DNA-binding domain-containing protein [Peptoniphilus lacrimalis]
MLKHLVGFSNAEGGQLVIGIEDDGEITGFIMMEHIILMNIKIFLLQS